MWLYFVMAGTKSYMPTILDYLNEDCWRAVLDYVPVRDIILTERTSRRWQAVVLTYLRSIKIGLTDPIYSHGHGTDVSRNVCVYNIDCTSFERWTNKLGPSVVSTYCSNEKFLKIVSENCPNLDSIVFYKLQDFFNQNRSFKRLRRICFNGCFSISVDYCLSQLMCNNTLEELEINANQRVTVQFLADKEWKKLKSLILKFTEALQTHHLLTVADYCQLTRLELFCVHKDIYPEIHWVVDKMPQLEYLHVYADRKVKNGLFFKSVSRLSHLKGLETDIEATDTDVEAIAWHCQELRMLRLENCEFVTGRGMAAVCHNAGARLSTLGLWRSQLADDDMVTAVSACPILEELDLRWCRKLTMALLARMAAARRVLGARRPLRLRGRIAMTRLSINEEDIYKELKLLE